MASSSFAQRFKSYLTPFDQRYEDLKRGNVVLNVMRDMTAGLVVAMIAIPLAMGFAMASGLRPEQGIVGGAVAGLVGALFGGSKYQVYGPTAAFIPIIGAIMMRHDHGYLVACSIMAGIILWTMGLARFGRIVKLVPHSIVVGFTIGIAATIALSQGAEIFGLHATSSYSAFSKLHMIATHFHTLEIEAVGLAVGTVVVMRLCLRISVFLPGPLVALALGIAVSQTLLANEGIVLIRDKYGSIPAMALTFTPPAFHELGDIGEAIYYTMAIVFVAAIESLLCSRMADRLAGNKGHPFDPDRELWGQGHVMVLVPLLNGFPHTGALARTATNIKLGAISPLAGVCKFALKLLLAYYLARYLELVPMPCIGGILLYVAMNMVKREEVTEVFSMGRAHVWLMLWTAGAVIAMDFLRGVVSALVIFGVWQIYAKVRKTKEPSHTLARFAAAANAKTAGEHEAKAPLDASADVAAKARAVLGERPHAHDDVLVTGRTTWLANIRRPGTAARSAFVHGMANVAGRVVLGSHVHIAAGSSVRADEGTPFYIGSNTNIQDGVVIHALKDKHVIVDGEQWAVWVGRNVSIAHDALVHGPCYVGDDTFIGFKAVVHDAVVGKGCFLGIASVVVGVEVPDGRFVPPGTIVDTNEKAKALPPAQEAHKHFNEDVVEVNRGLAAAYREHAGRSASPMPLFEREGMHESWDPPEPPNDRF